MTLALPTPREEAWRWSDLSDLEALAVAPATMQAPDGDFHWISKGPRLLFVDGKLDEGRSRIDGIEIGSTGIASGHPLGKLATGTGWTLALHRDGASPPGGPIEIIHVATGGANHLPAHIILAEDAQASIVETYIGDGWANRLTVIEMGRSARLMRAIRIVQDSGFTSLRDEARLDAGASLVTTLLGAGHGSSRIDAAIILDGPGAFAEHGGALLARDNQRHDAAVVLRHARELGTSRQLWRAVADDKATASMAARVEVARDAQKTDGYQMNQALLLSPDAEMDCKPELEIFADDVKCSHGATIGALDADQIFYLRSRGVPAAEARAILVRAFLTEAIDAVADDAIRALLEAGIAGWWDNQAA